MINIEQRNCQGHIPEFVQKANIFSLSRGGGHLLGPENTLKTIDFTRPMRGVAQSQLGFPIAIPLRAIARNSAQCLLPLAPFYCAELRYNCEQGSNKIFAELRGIARNGIALQGKICVARR